MKISRVITNEPTLIDGNRALRTIDAEKYELSNATDQAGIMVNGVTFIPLSAILQIDYTPDTPPAKTKPKTK